MRKHHPENERWKRNYLRYLAEAEGYSEDSIDQVAKALSRFEAYTKHQAFKAFHREQAIGFKRHLAEQTSCVTGKPLSEATLHSTTRALRSFFHWLPGQAGFKHLSFSDANYFRLSAKDTRIATARRERPVPTLEQIEHVLRTMPKGSDIELRDRALVAFAILTGARDGAMASLRLKHIDIVEGLVEFDAREVDTKASKTFRTWFFPVVPLARQIVIEWLEHLRRDLLWGNDDPVFPATRVTQGPDRQFQVTGLDHKPWSSADPIRDVFKAAFTRAGLQYFNPHSFRKTLGLFGEEICRTPEQFKAWSQNLGHEKVMTTFSSYGAVSGRRQSEIMRELASPKDSEAKEELLRQIAKLASRGG